MTAALDAIRALAEAATPGPWHWEGDSPADVIPEVCPHDTEWTDHGPDLVPTDYGPPGYNRVIYSFGYDASGLVIKAADAAYIAAVDPQTVLGLLAALDRAEAVAAAARDVFDRIPLTAKALLYVSDKRAPTVREDAWNQGVETLARIIEENRPEGLRAYEDADKEGEQP